MEFTHEDPGSRLQITGRIASADLPDARQAGLFALELGAGDLVLDLAGASVADVNALGLLLEIHHRAERSGRRLLLAEVPPELDRLLRRTRLGRVLHRQETAQHDPTPAESTRQEAARQVPAQGVRPGTGRPRRAAARSTARAARPATAPQPSLAENQLA